MPYDLTVRGWMPEMELKVVEEWAQLVPEGGIIIEIGSLHGRSAICWALSAPTVTVYALDLFNNYVATQIFSDEMTIANNFPRAGDVSSLEVFLANTSHIPNIIPVKVENPGVVPPTLQSMSPSLVFLDATHKNPWDWNILDFWLSRIAPGGVICGHDYGVTDFPDVAENAQRICDITGKSLEIRHSLWKVQL